MGNPIDDIEQKLSLSEIGNCGGTIYSGARAAGMSRLDAMYVVAGWFYALLVQGTQDANPSRG